MWLFVYIHCKNRIVVLTMDWLLEMCNVGVLLNEHTSATHITSIFFLGVITTIEFDRILGLSQ